MKPTAVKFAAGDQTTVEGWAAPNGGPFNGQDLYGEHFSAKTDFALDWFTERPLLYQHGLDPETGISVVGRVKSSEQRDGGLWAQAQLEASNQYFDSIKQLIDKGKLYFSSGAMSHLVKVEKRSGEITRWPWVELSLTPTPANLLATLDYAQAERHFKAAGIALPDGLRAELDAAARNDLDDSDFAYIDSDGGRHLPIHDEAHVRAAMSRFDQTQFESGAKKAAAAKKIVARARKLGIDVADDSAVAMAAKATKAMTEDADGDVDGDEDTPDADDGLAGVAHTATRTHTHRHSDGTEHRHGHHHAEGEPSHDTDVHTHPVPVPAEYKAIPPGAIPAEGYAGDPPEGTAEDWIDDLSERLNLPFGSPVPAMGYACVVATFGINGPGYCIVRYCMPGDDEDAYYRVDFTMGDDGEPVLGRASPLEKVYVPAKAAPSLLPLSLDAQGLARRAAALTSRTEGLVERRLKEGRVLSTANRRLLQDAVTAMGEASKAITDLLDATDRTQAEQAKAAHLRRPEVQARDLELLRLFAATLG